MVFAKIFRSLPKRVLGVGLLLVLSLPPAAFPLDTNDSQTFIAGFNAYQKKDYQTSVDKMSQVLRDYPDTPLRDMALFWLARANFKAGNLQDAGKYMAQFYKEYPDSPLKGTVEDDLATLAGKYQRGERIDDRPSAVQVAAKAKADAERLAAEQAKAEQERLTREQAETKRLAAEQQAAVAAAKAKAAAEQEAKARAEAEKAKAEQGRPSA